MSKSKNSLVKSAIVFAIVTVLAIVLWKAFITKEKVIEAMQYIESFGYWSLLVYALLYTTLVSLSFPSSVFNIGAGVLFPFFQAASIALFSGLAAASITFMLARFLLHDFTSAKIKDTEAGKNILKIVDSDCAKVIILLRLNPFIPAVVKNYGLGVTDIPYTTYAIFTLLGQIPLALMYVYLGWMGGHSMLDEQNSPDAVHWIVLGLGVLITISSLAASHFYFRKKMQTA